MRGSPPKAACSMRGTSPPKTVLSARGSSPSKGVLSVWGTRCADAGAYTGLILGHAMMSVPGTTVVTKLRTVSPNGATYCSNATARVMPCCFCMYVLPHALCYPALKRWLHNHDGCNEDHPQWPEQVLKP